jgi:hypothetical protein
MVSNRRTLAKSHPITTPRNVLLLRRNHQILPQHLKCKLSLPIQLMGKRQLSQSWHLKRKCKRKARALLSHQLRVHSKLQSIQFLTVMAITIQLFTLNLQVWHGSSSFNLTHEESSAAAKPVSLLDGISPMVINKSLKPAASSHPSNDSRMNE